MDLQHTFTVPVGVDAAWEAFTDIERIAPCLPGAVITSVDGDSFDGTAKVKLGPIALQYGGSGRWVSRDADTYSAVIEAQGKDRRGNGTAGATIRAHLEPEGSGTKVVVDTELKITGRPAQFGRGVIQDVGTKLLDQFAACLAMRLGEPAAQVEQEPASDAAIPPPETTPEAAVPPPAQPVASAAGPRASAGAPAASAGEGRPGGSPASRAPDVPAEVNLGGVVGPVLVKRYGPWVGALVVVAVVVWLISRG